VVQASFRKKYDYGYFYFRTSDHLDDKLQQASDDEKRQLLTDHKCESEYAARKLKELKQQIIDTGIQARIQDSEKEGVVFGFEEFNLREYSRKKILYFKGGFATPITPLLNPPLVYV